MNGTRVATKTNTSFLGYQTNQIGLEFLLVDLEVGLTFVDVAEASEDQRNKDRNYRNARKAYDTVARLLPKLAPSTEQRVAIESRLNRLKMRLRAQGQLF